MAKSITPLNSRFEKKRREAIASYQDRLLSHSGPAAVVALSIVISLISSFGEQLTTSDRIQYVVLAIVGFGALAHYYANRPVQAYRDDLRDNLFPIIVSHVDPTFTYRPTAPWTASDFNKFGILPYFTSEKVEHYVSGTYKGVGIAMTGVKLVRRSGKRSRVVFSGIVILLNTPRTIKSHVKVVRDMGFLGNIGLLGVHSMSGQRVRLEDPQFEDIFEVFGTDQIEARAVLTTSFMERLKQLALVHGKNEFQCAFLGDQIGITQQIPGEFMTLSSAWREVDLARDFETVSQDVAIIKSIIDTLKINQTAGL